MKTTLPEVVVIGDSTHNTLSIIRSLGRAGIRCRLILKCDRDICFVRKSRYLRKSDVVLIDSMDEAGKILRDMARGARPYLICTFDEAAEWVDSREAELSASYITPCRGKSIGRLFDKDAQCRLARECGLTVPRSVLFNRDTPVGSIDMDYPLLLKPVNSTRGEKADIHIIRSAGDFDKALGENSRCEEFLLQEFIDKEYELNFLGVSTDDGIIVPGAVRKIRHYPLTVGACSYGVYLPASEFDLNLEGLARFLKESHYHGPFSVEFLHSRGRDYFMEVNFRNDGLAKVATSAGANLHARYVSAEHRARPVNVRRTYMMNLMLDPLHMTQGRVGGLAWLRDLWRTGSFINLHVTDPMPFISRYIGKFR